MTKYITKTYLPICFKALNIGEYVIEYRFHPSRRWRFDYAWPDMKIAIEWEGVHGSYTGKSGHLTPKGYTLNCDKYNAATALGWSVYRFTPLQCLDDIMELLTKIFKKGAG